jgi:hypothetical protein
MIALIVPSSDYFDTRNTEYVHLRRRLSPIATDDGRWCIPIDIASDCDHGQTWEAWADLLIDLDQDDVTLQANEEV